MLFPSQEGDLPLLPMKWERIHDDVFEVDPYCMISVAKVEHFAFDCTFENDIFVHKNNTSKQFGQHYCQRVRRTLNYCLKKLV